ncbi:hypothetical protein ADUPG1_005939 [Aduncisulcus paluster]|uniref:Uncharacterized protein n=1 Tax=Aduncisulcus paluster TaxID=2918883 RepID=A0ABQ5KKT1_9EUKA|nr:hypothetical protein ADUPG1_005939 [Aduncisulcus paluster]
MPGVISSFSTLPSYSSRSSDSDKEELCIISDIFAPPDDVLQVSYGDILTSHTPPPIHSMDYLSSTVFPQSESIEDVPLSQDVNSSPSSDDINLSSQTDCEFDHVSSKNSSDSIESQKVFRDILRTGKDKDDDLIKTPKSHLEVLTPQCFETVMDKSSSMSDLFRTSDNVIHSVIEDFISGDRCQYEDKYPSISSLEDRSESRYDQEYVDDLIGCEVLRNGGIVARYLLHGFESLERIPISISDDK